jgi:hypothetical protein
MSTTANRPKARVRPSMAIGTILLILGLVVIGLAAIPGLNLLSSDSMPLALVIALIALLAGIVLVGVGMVRPPRSGGQGHV